MMSIVYHSASNNICDAIPLDNSSKISVPAMPYITWGLIWDHKIKEKIPAVIFSLDFIQDFQIKSRISKIGKKEPLSLSRAKTGS